ncbi:hypothetical protein GUITHDRAFT_145845 [Guillardia theta CCMP2712]|uniref:Uncharacterized protein n=1 Tax=Guillardia theta (strain CCMP2712) TaxID=905079 RepID=L1IJL1_GUITC|nr:hypothetical protein GUITHDRAFT_145845 [Guillardia theta CCMP2712]EKX36272.1 hypothetical protein GUITHDRAFT_145845 [Guillardia theta CCMP2712]|eukprot:XP_005823252.1 hypothetical protein GUITHDRAFT_145845 [Guillardia theta CCMP2712]
MWVCQDCGIEGEFSTPDANKCDWGEETSPFSTALVMPSMQIPIRAKVEQWPLYGIKKCCNCARESDWDVLERRREESLRKEAEKKRRERVFGKRKLLMNEKEEGGKSTKENVGQGMMAEKFFELSIEDVPLHQGGGEEEEEEEEEVKLEERSGSTRVGNGMNRFLSLTSSRLPRNLNLRPKSSPVLSPPQGLVSSSDLCILECLNNDEDMDVFLCTVLGVKGVLKRYKQRTAARLKKQFACWKRLHHPNVVGLIAELWSTRMEVSPPDNPTQYLSKEVYPVVEKGPGGGDCAGKLRRAKARDCKDRPISWLARYLKDRNVQNTAARYEQRVKESFDMASRETQDFVTYLDNTVAAVRLLLWPCTCYIAQKQIEIQKVEKPKNENEEMKEGEEGEGEGEGEKAGAGEEEAKEEEGNEESNGEKGEEEEEGGGGMKKVEEEEEVIEIKWLRWVSTSHPCKDTIEGFALKYEEEGMLGPVLNHRTIVFVPDVNLETRALPWEEEEEEEAREDQESFSSLATGKKEDTEKETRSMRVMRRIACENRRPRFQTSNFSISRLIHWCWLDDPCSRPTSQELLRVLEQGLFPEPLHAIAEAGPFVHACEFGLVESQNQKLIA